MGAASTSGSTAIANGFGHGHVYLWAEDGTLMATASQSTIVRWWDPAVLEAELKQGLGGALRCAGSDGLMRPTELPSGSSTTA